MNQFIEQNFCPPLPYLKLRERAQEKVALLCLADHGAVGVLEGFEDIFDLGVVVLHHLCGNDRSLRVELVFVFRIKLIRVLGLIARCHLVTQRRGFQMMAVGLK